MQQREFSKMFQVEDKHWWFVSKRLFAKTFLGIANKKFTKILDIGCGTGRNLIMLRRYGQVFGVDINPLALKFCSRRGQKNVRLGEI